MNLTVNATPAASAAVPARALSAADLLSGSSAARPLAGFAAAAAADDFSTAAAVNGRTVEIRVSVNHRAREAYARATSVPAAVDPTAARTSASALAVNRGGRGRLAVASQWDR